jgi:hypothetical protein
MTEERVLCLRAGSIQVVVLTAVQVVTVMAERQVVQQVISERLLL